MPNRWRRTLASASRTRSIRWASPSSRPRGQRLRRDGGSPRAAAAGRRFGTVAELGSALDAASVRPSPTGFPGWKPDRTSEGTRGNRSVGSPRPAVPCPRVLSRPPPSTPASAGPPVGWSGTRASASTASGQMKDPMAAASRAARAALDCAGIARAKQVHCSSHRKPRRGLRAWRRHCTTTSACRRRRPGDRRRHVYGLRRGPLARRPVSLPGTGVVLLVAVQAPLAGSQSSRGLPGKPPPFSVTARRRAS